MFLLLFFLLCFCYPSISLFFFFLLEINDGLTCKLCEVFEKAKGGGRHVRVSVHLPDVRPVCQNTARKEDDKWDFIL